MATTEQLKPTQEEVQTSQRKAYGWGGIGVSTPDENNVVTIQQGAINNGRVLTEKQLVKRAKRIYPNAKIKPLVFSPNLDMVTPEWVKEQQKKYGITQTALARHLGLNQGNLNQVLKGKVGLSLGIKSLLFYIFYIFEQNMRGFESLLHHRVQRIQVELKYRTDLSDEDREDMERELAEYQHELESKDF